jgi:phosphatidylserine/phosphatidylglycerophosphate/cardiolipin synthase-like enzyme
MQGLLTLSPPDIRALREAVRSGRLPEPFLPALIERIVPSAAATDISAALRSMVGSGANREGLVAALELLAAARSRQPSIDELIELVTTGPEPASINSRDTQVVVQDLFRSAERSVILAGYELYQTEPVFRTLAERMNVRMFLNVKRPFGNTSADGELLAGFASRFRCEHWPVGKPVPEIYFDPRSLAAYGKPKAVLHAKCVVVDGATSFVSSANFTEAAQERNIEVGVLVRSPLVAGRLTAFFAGLVATGTVRRVL